MYAVGKVNYPVSVLWIKKCMYTVPVNTFPGWAYWKGSISVWVTVYTVRNASKVLFIPTDILRGTGISTRPYT